jgi:hypothetical protein
MAYNSAQTQRDAAHIAVRHEAANVRRPPTGRHPLKLGGHQCPDSTSPSTSKPSSPRHLYPWAQLTQACVIAQALDRGKFVLVQAPWDA